MKKFISNFNKGFTIIESLVAISILMIAIAGPLTVANRGYTAALDAKYEAAAINLAQESLEYISYVKDNHIWGNWQDGASFDATVDVQYKQCVSDNLCDFDSIAPNNLKPMPSVFTSRKFYFRPESPNQVSAIVIVNWSLGGVDHSISLNQVLTNYER